MQSDDGRVKVLDFGLAKPKGGLASAANDSDLPTQHRTEEGRILGTVSYMSEAFSTGELQASDVGVFTRGARLGSGFWLGPSPWLS